MQHYSDRYVTEQHESCIREELDLYAKELNDNVNSKLDKNMQMLLFEIKRKLPYIAKDYPELFGGK
jgi:hypothetical protein